MTLNIIEVFYIGFGIGFKYWLIGVDRKIYTVPRYVGIVIG